jgi:hypothetical protein
MQILLFLVSAIAMSLASAAFQIGLATGHFKSYEWAMIPLFVASAVLWIVWIILAIRHYILQRQKSETSPLTPPIVRDITQSAEANPQQNIYIGADLVPRESKLQKEPPPLPPTPKPRANVHFVETKSIGAHQGLPTGATIYESPTGEGLEEFQACIACFRNETIPGMTLREPRIKSHIIYKDKLGREIADAPRGVWLGRYGEDAIFEQGIKRCVIVFVSDGDATLKAPLNESYYTQHSWMSNGPSFRIEAKNIPNSVASVEISLLTGDTCLKRATFDVLVDAEQKVPKLVITSQTDSVE